MVRLIWKTDSDSVSDRAKHWVDNSEYQDAGREAVNVLSQTAELYELLSSLWKSPRTRTSVRYESVFNEEDLEVRSHMLDVAGNSPGHRKHELSN